MFFENIAACCTHFLKMPKKIVLWPVRLYIDTGWYKGRRSLSFDYVNIQLIAIRCNFCDHYRRARSAFDWLRIRERKTDQGADWMLVLVNAPRSDLPYLPHVHISAPGAILIKDLSSVRLLKFSPFKSIFTGFLPLLWFQTKHCIPHVWGPLPPCVLDFIFFHCLSFSSLIRIFLLPVIFMAVSQHPQALHKVTGSSLHRL